MRWFAVGTRAGLAFAALIVAADVSGQAPITTPCKSEVSLRKVDSSKKLPKKPTFIEFELLQAPDGGGQHAQQWLKILEPLDVSLRVHRPLLDEKPELKERTVGNLRYLTVIGTLDRSGKMNFPDRSFTLTDSVKLKEWIDELRTYGIKGNPAGQQLWGLSKDQFTGLFDRLTQPVDFETDDLPLAQLVAKLPISKQTPLHWTADATELLSRRADRTKLKQELKGFSTGTVLSIALRENGLGYRPNRTPIGDVELLIEPRAVKQDQWPVGWPVQRQTSKAIPKLYAMVPIELADVELSDVISAISKLSETPILIDNSELDAKQIQLDKIKVSFPRKITTWGIALSRLVVPQKLTREIWQDEAGRVFVWITTSQAGRTKDIERPDL